MRFGLSISLLICAVASATCGALTAEAGTGSRCGEQVLRPTIGSFGEGIGRAPLWGVALDGPRATAVLAFGRTRLGYRHKLLWLVKAGFKHPLKVWIEDVSGGASYIGVGGRRPARVVTLDPADPPIPAGTRHAVEFPSTIYVRGPGCYRIRAEWPNGRLAIALRAVKG